MNLLVMIPTYNEIENIDKIVSDLLSLGVDMDILFIDDNSPDGTGKRLDEIADKNKNIQVLHRSGKLGIGSAHKDGIRWAYEKGYQSLVTMDCDFTHSPSYILDFLKAKDDCDLVVGSRYLEEKSLREWNLFRKLLTNGGHLMTKYLLRIPYDATGAFRLYRLDRLPEEFLDKIESQSYSFFFESMYVLMKNEFIIKEVPTVLPARTYGHSKMKFSDALHSVMLMFELIKRSILRPSGFYVQNKKTSGRANSSSEWDRYWVEGSSGGFSLYGVIASFYRKFIIRPSLKRFLDRYFAPGSDILHAGCGSGQVDQGVVEDFNISVLDISPQAIKTYESNNPGVSSAVIGDIMQMPFEDRVFDGIYNLGVMEHFEEHEIKKVLKEFSRVLRDDGKAVLFWPPEYGLSVVVLKIVHGALRLFGSKKKLHPDEISRIKSRDHIGQMLDETGFVLSHYHFGAGDFFTYAVLVLEKKNS